ncbi:MAG: Ig-like domain-containing protein, partial [Candidatus Hodarchaeota archaeon]
MVPKYRFKFVYSFLIIGIFLIATPAHASFIAEIFQLQPLSLSDDKQDQLLSMLGKNSEQEDDLDILSFSPKTTSIDIVPVEMHQGEKGWFSAVLTNKSNGDRIEDASVSFFVSKSNSSTIEWDLLGSAITDSQGIATVKSDIYLPSGSYALKAEFYGDTRFMGTSKETSDQNGLIILPKQSPQVTAYVPNRSFFYGFSKPIPIKIETESLNWQDGDRISIDVIGQGDCYSQCDFTFSSEGIIDLEIPSYLKPGDYSINVWHHKENNNYCSSRIIGRGALSVQILLTIVNVFPATGCYSDDVNIQANLESVSGDPISETPLIFSLVTPDGTLEYLGTVVTNENGLATLITPLWMHPGIHNITVEFEGSNSHATSQGQNTLIVFKENTQIYLPLAETISEDYFDIVAYLYDDDYSPLRDLELIFYYRDHELGDIDPWHLIGTNKTGIDGKATYRMQKTSVPTLTDILVLFK